MKSRAPVVLVLLLGLLAGRPASGQDEKVRNTVASVSDGLVKVSYTLVGQEGQDYNVGLLIASGGDEQFEYRAEAVSGDVGGGIQGGAEPRRLQIQWQYRNRFPEGLPEEVDYRVVVREERDPAVSAGEVGVRNVTASRSDRLITVGYDLLGERGEGYQVTLLISASGGETFDYKPEAVSGDVGEDVRPGSGKQIQWRYREDFPEGLQRDIRYRVQVEEEGGNGWWYALGSAVVVGGGATAAAVLTGLIGGDGGGGYPAPPAPPGN